MYNLASFSFYICRMNGNRYVSAFLIILALLAGLSQEQKKASNQQILLQFVDGELASETAQDEVLVVIKQKLQVLGVHAIQIIENDARQLSIRYYSDVDADSVKAFLSQETQLGLVGENDSSSDAPEEKVPEKYHLIVSEIHLQFDCNFTLNGALVSNQKQKHNSFSFPALLPFETSFGFKGEYVTDLVHTTERNDAIDKTSHNIPEVRAGPYENKNS